MKRNISIPGCGLSDEGGGLAGRTARLQINGKNKAKRSGAENCGNFRYFKSVSLIFRPVKMKMKRIKGSLHLDIIA